MSDQLFEDKPQEFTIDPDKEYLADLVGEGKKYKTPEDLARAVLHKDNFIETLKAERQRDAAELSKRERLEEMLDRLTSTQTLKPPTSEDTPPIQRTAIDPNEVQRLVETAVSKHTSETRAQENLAAVRGKLEQDLGSEWQAKLEQRRKELNFSREEMTALAAKNPQGFLKIVSPTPPKQADLFAPPARSVNTDASMNQVSGVRDAKYYDALKKSDPKSYRSESIQAQRHRDAVALGERFFAT